MKAGYQFEIGRIYATTDRTWIVVRVDELYGVTIVRDGKTEYVEKPIEFFNHYHEEITSVELTTEQHAIYVTQVQPRLNRRKAVLGCTCDNHSLFNQGCTCGWIKIERAKKK